MGDKRHKFDINGSKIGAFVADWFPKHRSCPRCGVPVEHPGPCKPCFDASALTDLLEKLDRAAEKIPAKEFGKVRFGNADLRARVKSPGAEAFCRERVVNVAIPWTCLTLYGHSGAGKSSLAAAMLWEVLRVARKGREVERARGAFFVSAKAIAGEVTEDRKIAAQSTFLVLDDLGQETDGALPGSVTYSELVGPVREFLEARLRSDFKTVITTGFNAPSLEKMYGVNIQRRMFDKNLGNYAIDLDR